MRVYTRNGDEGLTGLYGTADRCFKSDSIFNFLGDLDEANALLGIILSDSIFKTAQSFSEPLKKAQHILFDIGSIAGGLKKELPLKRETENLEYAINIMEDQLDPLKTFILPGPGYTVSQIHLARAVVRRTERSWVAQDTPSDINK